MARTLVVGPGYVGSEIVRRLAARGVACVSLVRSVRALEGEVVLGDLRDPVSLASLPHDIERVAYLAAPDERTDAAYRDVYVDGLRAILRALRDKRAPLTRLVFVSSTAVYAQRDGEWIDEDSETRPTRFTGVRVLEAESVARDGAPSATALRLGGIYGPGRARLVESVLAGEATLPRSLRFVNRIHRDDAAEAVVTLLFAAEVGPSYVGVDDEPADLGTTLRYLAHRAGLPPPRVETDGEPAELGKRGRNDRLRALGLSLSAPTYREGYGALLDAARLAARDSNTGRAGAPRRS